MKSFCWDSKNKDRRYYADDWARYFAQFISNGVYAFTATNMQVQANGGRTVKIAVGSCFINGRAGYAEGDDVLTLDFGGGGSRIDRIVARLDVPNREIQPYVIKGEVAETPTAPDIIRDGTYYDICLAEITVPANATEITQADITDVRGNNEVCGFVTGLIKQIDTADFFAQFTAEWALLRAACAQDEEAVIAAWAALNTTKSVNGVAPVDGNVFVTLDNIPDGNNRKASRIDLLVDATSTATDNEQVKLIKPLTDYDTIVINNATKYYAGTSASASGTYTSSIAIILPTDIQYGYPVKGTSENGTFIDADTFAIKGKTETYNERRVQVYGVKYTQ